jgi:hypothetical protein
MVRVNSGSTTYLTKCRPVEHTRILFAWFIEYQEGTLDTTNASNDKSREPLTGKKPYKAPSFRFQVAFEVSALVCGKIDPTQSTCTSNRKLS